MNITDDEALGFMDRLLEWLRQADLTNFGSRIEVASKPHRALPGTHAATV